MWLQNLDQTCNFSDITFLRVIRCLSHRHTWDCRDLWSCNIRRVLNPLSFFFPFLTPWCDKKWEVHHQTVGQTHCSRCCWHLWVLTHFLRGECLRFLPLGRSWKIGCCTARDATEATDNFPHPLLIGFFSPLFFPPFSYSSKCIKEVHLGHFRPEH